MKFTDLEIHPSFHQALAARGFDEATPVQEAVLAADAKDRDLLVSSRTGSGKTLAFGLAIGEALVDRLGADRRNERPLALVVAPTRELALQVERELQWLYEPAGARVASCVGGMDFRREQRALQGGAQIVVGTPGRLCDHLERRTLDLSGLQAVILDEADEMLDMGFREDLERILKGAPPERRTLLFSATLPRAIDDLARRFQKDALRIAATSPEAAHQDIEYRAHLIAAREIEVGVVNTLRFHDAPRALVFCATRDGVARLSASLAERGFEAVALSGELSQAERTRALKSLRDGRAKVLVATDVAARGLDLPEVSLVIHADLPVDAQVMQHRSGRTGRAGRKGVSVVLSPVGKKRVAERLLNMAKVRPSWTPLPSHDEIRALDQERLLRDLLAASQEAAPEDLEVATRLLAERPAEDLVAGLVKVHRAGRPAPGALPQTASALNREATFEGTSTRAAAPRVKSWSTAGADSSPGGHRPARPRPSAGGDGDGIWFRMNVGRVANADPRWLVPILCRRGGISNKEIGRIQILDRESRFQIAPAAADAFEASAGRPDTKDPSIRIQRLRESDAPAGIPSFERESLHAPRPASAAKRAVRKAGDGSADESERPFRPAEERDDEAAVRPSATPDVEGDRPVRAAPKRYGDDEARPPRPAAKRDFDGADRPPRPAAKRDGEGADRPFRAAPKRYGDDAARPFRPAAKRDGEGADRPFRAAPKRFGDDAARPFRPAAKRDGEGADRPFRATPKRFGDDAARPFRPAAKRDGEGADRPFRAAPKRFGDDAARPFRPAAKRDGEGADRPFRAAPKRYGDDAARPFRPAAKRDGDGADRPFRAAPKRFGDDAARPFSPGAKRFGDGGDRPYRPAAKRPGDGGDRPYRPATKRPGEGGDRPYRPATRRPGDGGDRPYRPATKRAGGDRPVQKRIGDDRPFSPSAPRFVENAGKPPKRSTKPGKGTKDRG